MKNIAFILFPIFLWSQTAKTDCGQIQKDYLEILNSKIDLSIQNEEYRHLLSNVENSSCTDEIININLALFSNYLKQGDIENALKKDEDLKQYEMQNQMNLEQLSQYGANEGKLYYFIGDFKNSNKKIHSTITQAGKAMSPSILSSQYDQMGKNYLQLYKTNRDKKELLDSANHYFNISYSILKQNDSFDFNTIKGRFYSNKIDYYLATEDYENALKTANHAILINDAKPSDSELIRKFNLDKALAYFQLEKYDSVLIIKNQLNQFLYKSSDDERLQLYNLYQKTYEKLNNSDSANKYLSLNYNILENLNKAKSNSLKKLYGIDIQSLEKENQKQSFNNQSKTKWIVALLLLIGIGVAIWYISHQKISKKYDKLFQEKYKELQYLKDNTADENKEGNVQNEESKNPLTEELIAELAEKIKKSEENLWFLKPEFNLNYLSKRLNTNTSYLSYYFNHIKKQSFPNYLNYLRINYILKELNENPKLLQYSMEGLAKESGFRDASVFSKIFKKIVGLPPSYYVENLIKEKNRPKAV